MIEPIELHFTVPCSPEQAFEVWTSRTSTWWPSSHSVSGELGLTVTIEPRVGGRIVERTPRGDEHTWGEVLAWDPPASFTYRWHLNQDVSDATEVTIAFDAVDDGTEVHIAHRGWERLGAKGPDLQQRNRHGWAGVLPHFQDACAA
ncbi:MAG TPA: SRPBCC domain-containing protein [Actinomycetota bacterium]|nr:SRPBCC domain-containing protein [Actinomycetota bacterium]